MSAHHNYANGSLHATERQVLELWDSGLGIPAIAERTGKYPTYVRAIVERYVGSGDRAFEQMTRDGSAALLAAIRRHHPERFVGARP